jgi:hypothetical protein
VEWPAVMRAGTVEALLKWSAAVRAHHGGACGCQQSGSSLQAGQEHVTVEAYMHCLGCSTVPSLVLHHIADCIGRHMLSHAESANQPTPASTTRVNNG